MPEPRFAFESKEAHTFVALPFVVGDVSIPAEV